MYRYRCIIDIENNVDTKSMGKDEIEDMKNDIDNLVHDVIKNGLVIEDGVIKIKRKKLIIDGVEVK